MLSKPLYFEWQPSLWLGAWLLLVFLGPLLIVWTFMLPNALLFSVIVLSSVSMYHSIRRYVSLSHPRAICCAYLACEGDWRVVDRQGQTYIGRLRPDSVVSQWFACLLLHVEGHQRPIILLFFPDSLRCGSLRHLCKVLRLAY